MATSGRLAERAIAATTAVLLQAALYLALSQRQPSLFGVATGPRLVAMILAATRPKRRAPPPPHASERLLPIPVTAHPMVEAITPAAPQRHASRSAVDWQTALQREVRAEESRSHAPPKLEFGFPKMPVTEGPAPEFGWNENSLDRVQRLAHGIIDLSDDCFIKLWPPIPVCDSGPANGDLFQHMHDPKPPEGPNTLP